MIREDYDLSAAQVQELSGRDALAAFFARLGYNTNERVVQSVSAMGLSSDNLKLAVKHIERLASQDAGLFEVYLFELKSVTVATTQALVRSFRNRSGDYLLILSDGYERLDFVLVERFSPESTRSQSGGGTGPLGLKPQVGVRPRILTVKRNNPDPVALRVLRRFSYTESDTFAQYDKLVSAYDVAEWSRPFFNNRALFSDYYLTERLPQSAEWSDKDELAHMTRAYRILRTLYADVRDDFSNQKEAVIRTKLLEPTLAALGFSFKADKSAGSDAVEPDYRLYSINTPDQNSPLALGLTYTWNRNLDGKDDSHDSETPDENPGAVVVGLLDKGEAEWAIVTNGKIWRLYAAKAHSRATNYYEIDLEETLALPEASRAEAFRYFWLLFRASAFAQTATPDKPSFLDTLITESERYARELGERLKERVFEEIFPHFARGFITYARRNPGLLPADFDNLSGEARAKALEPFFSGTLTFLYRLLFLLYAESRDLLPVREVRGYYEKSLEKLKQIIADKAGKIEDTAPKNIREKFNDLSTDFYDALQELFRAIDKGEPALNVPVYNGGLFVTEPDPADTSSEAQTARFLANCKIPDRELALGLDRMARDIDEKRHDLAFIDYKSLGVRQLGSIYEGLLEFKLRVAPETMAVIKGKKTEEIVPLIEAQQKKLPILKEGRGKDAADRTLSKNTVYLENDRRERKATGSYYTPDYIVKYIVENTVGPILKEKMEALRPAFRKAEETLRAERSKYEALKKQGRSGDSPENQAYLKHRAEVNALFFDLKVLDPAMGSGHFLVEAVDYITDRLADFLSQFRWNPIVHELTETRRQIQGEMERQNISVNAGKLTDINLLKRQVLKRCIYGVDLNPMAVELAKVSLWLDCFTLGAPLSFLDHHMKAGNSLIGGSVQEVQDALSRDLFGNQFAGLLSATSLMQQVGQLSDITVEQVGVSRSTYRQAFDALAPFKRLLDVWISQHFGNKGAQQTASLYAGAIVADNHTKTNPVDKKAIETARALSAAKRFFHWELEFPEVFYNNTERKPDGGFDAVVGNPPYVRQEGLGEDKVIFQKAYRVYTSIADLYTYFIERGNVLLRPEGRFGMITANKFMRANYGAALRSFLTDKVRLEKLIDFGDLPVFGDATTYPIVLLSAQGQRKGAAIEYALLKSLSFKALSEAIQATASKMPDSAFSGTNWSLAAASTQTVLDKLKANSIPLGQYVNGKIQYGIKTGFNEAFYIDRATRDRLLAEDPKSAEIIKPLLVGEDVKRYDIDYKERYSIVTKVGVPIQKYPAIFKHLQQYQTQLEKRYDKGKHWWELRHCDYYDDFDKPKIVYPNICMQPEFAFDTNGYYSNQKTFIIPIENKGLLAILSSKLMLFIFESTIPKLRGGFFEPGYVFMKDVPIRRITFSTPEKERGELVEEMKGLYRAGLGAGR